MFYAAFLTKLPKPLRDHINEYLGDRAQILWTEAKWFHSVINRLYLFLCMMIRDVNNYNVSARPVADLRKQLIEVYDLKIEFSRVRKGESEVYPPLDVRDLKCVRNFLDSHNELFTRSTKSIISILNLAQMLSWQGERVSEFSAGVVDRVCWLRLNNRRYIRDRLIYSPAEVLNTDLLDVPSN